MEELVTLSASQDVVDKAWLVIGDFNQTTNPYEHSCPQTLKVDRKMREFKECLLEADLSDLNFRGSTFTWWKLHPIAKKLDRVLANDKWLATHTSACAIFGAPIFSDHASCSVSLSSQQNTRKKPFKFFNFLLTNENFRFVVEEHWFSVNIAGTSMYRVSKKIKSMKRVIKSFSKDNYSGIEKRVAEAQQVVIQLQEITMSNPSPANAERVLEAERKWKLLAEAKESFFCQRSHITCFSAGDSSTAFYHRMVATRKSINHIHYLIAADGARIESQGDIHRHSVEYFSNLLNDTSDQ